MVRAVRWVSILAVTLLLGLALSCSNPPRPAPEAQPAGIPWFVEVTKERGIDFVHDPGPAGRYFFPQIVGSGAALFDFDGDGRLDIYLVQNGGPESRSTNRLYHQEADGTFKDVSVGSGLDVAGYGMGVAIGDVNNDGRPDVLLTEYGRTRLFLNLGGGKFQDITKEAGIDNPLWGTSASFVDYDRDGWLDLVIANYVDYNPAEPCGNAAGRPDFCSPKVFPGTVPRLYRNRGGEGKGVSFEDVSASSGLGRVPGPGLGVLCADFNGDGWPDIFIANDGDANRLWINQHDGTFKEEAVSRGLAYNGTGQTQANMGVAWGDVDGDGLSDLFVTHLTEETNTLWQQRPLGLFSDRTVALGLAGGRWRGTGFGTILADFDHDGALDLALVNGRVARPKSGGRVDEHSWSLYAERNQLFSNDGSGHFRDVSPENTPFCGNPGIGRGLAWGDFDNDGAIDLLVTELGGPARLFRNVAPKRGHWLMVRAVDPKLRRDAYGALVTVRAGARSWPRLINPGQSYLCSGDPRAHFGLGPVERIDTIDVLWPDGTRETFPGGAVDHHVELRKGEGGRP